MGNTRILVNSALHPSGVAKSSTSCGWGNGGNVTSAGWQVTLCDPMWHVSSRSGVATLRTAIHLLLTYLRVTTSPTCANCTHTFNGPLSGTTRVSRYQKGKTNLDFTEARDSEWQWHQLGHMQVCTSLQTDNYASTPPLSCLQAGCPSCRPTNSVKALKVQALCKL